MKVVFFVPVLNIGGYERVVINYANYFSNHHDVTIVCGKAEGEMRKAISPDVQVVDLQVRARFLLFALTKWLKANRADIFYVPFATYTSIAVLAKKFARSRVIIYGIQHGFENNGKIVSWVLRRFIQQADVLGAVSPAVAEHESKRWKIDRVKYHIFDNPVFAAERATTSLDLDWFKKAEGPVLVTSGRLARDKHIEIPIMILAEVKKTHPNVRLLILGDGPEKDDLEMLVCKLGVEDSVLFAGYVNDPIAYMEHCDIYMQTSEIESFGNGVIEAQTCDLPAIVTDCGGPVDLIGDKFGVCIGRFDHPEVVKNGADAVRQMITKEVSFSGMRENSTRYNVANLEEQFFEPYHRIKSKDLTR